MPPPSQTQLSFRPPPPTPHPTPEKCSGSAHDEDIALQLKNMNDALLNDYTRVNI